MCTFEEENKKVFCKNCQHIYGYDYNQCSFISGIEKFTTADNFTIDIDEIGKFKDKINFEVAYGNLKREDVNLLFNDRPFIHVINGKTIGIPSTLNSENSCNFYKEIKNNADEGISGKSLLFYILKLIFVVVLITGFYLILPKIIP